MSDANPVAPRSEEDPVIVATDAVPNGPGESPASDATHHPSALLRVSGVSKVLLLSGVGRTYESQADRLGVRLLAKAGYDPTAMVRVLQLLQRLGSENPGLLSSLVATHPPTADRIKKIKAELAPRHAETQREGAGLH